MPHSLRSATASWAAEPSSAAAATTRWRRAALTCCGLAALAMAGPPPSQAAPPRYTLGTDDGQQIPVRRITDWHPEANSFQTDQRQWFGSRPALRWLVDHQADLPDPPAAWLETWTGDRVPGQVELHVAGAADAFGPGPYLTLRSKHVAPREVSLPHQDEPLRVLTRAVRQIVWQPTHPLPEPGSLVTRDGRHLSFRVLRWQATGVTILTGEGRASFEFSALAALHLPTQPQWDAILQELATLAPQGTGWLVQCETSDGVLATTCWERLRLHRLPSDAPDSRWWLGVQPAWSLDLLWLEGARIPWLRFFAPLEVPLSRLQPVQVEQASPLAQQGRRWRRDRNVEGGPLQVGDTLAGWGFGVHASNQLHFELPPWAQAFRCGVGLDVLAGDGGCVRTAVRRQTSQGALTLFESPTLTGSRRPVATGVLALGALESPSQLVLQTDLAHAARPPGADPLDIRDSTDWLDPVLYLHADAPGLRAALREQALDQMTAWRSWQPHLQPEADVRLQHVWCEPMEQPAHFTLATRVCGTTPLRLTRTVTDTATQQLTMTVSCPLHTHPPAQLAVLVDDQICATFPVPVLDRQHPELTSQRVSLGPRRAGPETPLALEIRQLPGATLAPVCWHRLELE